MHALHLILTSLIAVLVCGGAGCGATCGNQGGAACSCSGSSCACSGSGSCSLNCGDHCAVDCASSQGCDSTCGDFCLATCEGPGGCRFTAGQNSGVSCYQDPFVPQTEQGACSLQVGPSSSAVCIWDKGCSLQIATGGEAVCAGKGACDIICTDVCTARCSGPGGCTVHCPSGRCAVTCTQRKPVSGMPEQTVSGCRSTAPPDLIRCAPYDPASPNNKCP